jgi:hypothetical protein
MASSPRRFGLGGAESRRLVDGGATVKERLLLQAAIDESPPDSAGRQRTLAALGIVVVASTVTSTAAAAAVSRAAALGQAKWLVFGAVGAAVAVGGAELATPSDLTPSLAPAVSSVGRKATAPAPRGASRIERALPAAVSPSALPLLPAPPPVAKNVRATAALSSRSSPAELVAQVAALDRARAALHAGRPGESVALLDGFDRSYPGSRLGPEAIVVRVSALLALGQRTQATGLVQSYCRKGGPGAYGPRLMKLVGLSETACEGSESDP